MKVVLIEDGRMVPGTSHPYWEDNHEAWLALKQGELVDVNVAEYVALFENDELRNKHKANAKFFFERNLRKKQLEKKVQVDEKKLLKGMENFDFDDDAFFLSTNPGLAEVTKSNRLKDKIAESTAATPSTPAEVNV